MSSDSPSNLVVMKRCMCCCWSLWMASPSHECYLMDSRFPVISAVDFPDWAMPRETRFPSRHHSASILFGVWVCKEMTVAKDGEDEHQEMTRKEKWRKEYIYYIIMLCRKSNVNAKKKRRKKVRLM